MEKIDRFEGKYVFLSNFYPASATICDFMGIGYPTVEHYFQAMKSLDFAERVKIAAAPTPGAAKRMGRRVALRADWEEIKKDIMYRGLCMKFSDHELQEKLLATGNVYLEEGNQWHDTYWGVCDGVGRNQLGHLLMRVRKELQKHRRRLKKHS